MNSSSSLPEGISNQPSEIYVAPSKKSRLRLIILIFILILIGIVLVIFIRNPAFFNKFPLKVSKEQKPGSCLILEEQYCFQGEVIKTKNSLGWDQIYIGFKLPARVPIFAGQDGQVAKVKLDKQDEYQGYRAVLSDPDLSKPTGRAIVAIGDLTFDNMLSLNVKQGAVIGHIGASGVTNLGGYNLLITIRERNAESKTSSVDTKTLQTLFPKLNYEK